MTKQNFLTYLICAATHVRQLALVMMLVVLLPAPACFGAIESGASARGDAFSSSVPYTTTGTTSQTSYLSEGGEAAVSGEASGGYLNFCDFSAGYQSHARLGGTMQAFAAAYTFVNSNDTSYYGSTIGGDSRASAGLWDNYTFSPPLGAPAIANVYMRLHLEGSVNIDYKIVESAYLGDGRADIRCYVNSLTSSYSGQSHIYVGPPGFGWPEGFTGPFGLIVDYPDGTQAFSSCGDSVRVYQDFLFGPIPVPRNGSPLVLSASFELQLHTSASNYFHPELAVSGGVSCDFMNTCSISFAPVVPGETFHVTSTGGFDQWVVVPEPAFFGVVACCCTGLIARRQCRFRNGA